MSSSSLSCVAACSRCWVWCKTSTITSVIAAANVENAISHEFGKPATASAIRNATTKPPTAPAAAGCATKRSSRCNDRLTGEREGTGGSTSCPYPTAPRGERPSAETKVKPDDRGVGHGTNLDEIAQ